MFFPKADKMLIIDSWSFIRLERRIPIGFGNFILPLLCLLPTREETNLNELCIWNSLNVQS